MQLLHLTWLHHYWYPPTHTHTQYDKNTQLLHLTIGKSLVAVALDLASGVDIHTGGEGPTGRAVALVLSHLTQSTCIARETGAGHLTARPILTLSTILTGVGVTVVCHTKAAQITF